MATELSARRRLVAGLVAAGVLVYLVGGIGVAVYLLNRVRKPAATPPARAENVTAAVPVRTKPPVAESPNSFETPRPPEPPVAALTAAEVEANPAIERGVRYL